MKRNYPSIIITPEGEKWLDKGQMWMYKNNLGSLDDSIENGSLVDIMTTQGRYLGTGFLSKESHITVRILTKNQNEVIDREFFKKRIQFAYDFRKTVEKDNLTNCRLVFGEADSLPGLTADRYNEIIVTQITSYGLDLIKDMIYELLLEVLKEDGQNVSAIYERNDVKIRELEGMQQYKGFYRSSLLDPAAEKTRVDIVENGIRYTVDVENGQKTGFFLDQKFNRLAAAQIGKGRHVLDCFTHTGAFALNIAKGGAASVTALDISKEAVEMTAHNAKQNGLAVEAAQADVFDFLTELDKKKDHSYDYIVLDPPAFTKSGKTVHEAFRGYKEINYRAMKLLPRGGYLATASCSHFATEELFIKMLRAAAKDAHRQLRQIEVKQQAPDHPILWGVPETNYLKFFLFQVI